MSVLTTQPIIFWADQVPTKLVICLKIESSVGRKYTVLAIMGSNTLSDAISIIFIHLSDVRKYSSSNWYVSLWHNIRCSRLIMCPKLVTLLDNLSYFCRIRHCVDHKGGYYILSADLPIMLIHLREVMKHSRSSGCLSLQQNVISPGLIWCPKLVSLLNICK